MNLHRPFYFTGTVRWLGAGLALLVFLAVGQAEPVDGGRWLFIFDTSSVMKKNLPATEVALKQFLIISAGGELATGDSVAAWTVGRQVSGQFPTFTWRPEQAVTSTSNLITFLEEQRYSGDSKLALLQAPISRVVANSKRLTIILFCDGQNEITGTPYDETINQTFRASKAERKKSRQPFIVIFRAQLGQIIGCTLSFPPGGIDLPIFPPLPAPPAPPVANTLTPVPQPVVAPVVMAPDLVIVGTKVGTNLDMLPDVPPPGKTTSEPVKPDAATTNSSPAKSPGSPPAASGAKVTMTNLPTMAASMAAPAGETNAVMATTTNAPDQPMKVLIYLGVALLAAAAVLILTLLARNRRRPQPSLITSSMQDAPPRRK